MRRGFGPLLITTLFGVILAIGCKPDSQDTGASVPTPLPLPISSSKEIITSTPDSSTLFNVVDIPAPNFISASETVSTVIGDINVNIMQDGNPTRRIELDTELLKFILGVMSEKYLSGLPSQNFTGIALGITDQSNSFRLDQNGQYAGESAQWPSFEQGYTAALTTEIGYQDGQSVLAILLATGWAQDPNAIIPYTTLNNAGMNNLSVETVLTSSAAHEFGHALLLQNEVIFGNDIEEEDFVAQMEIEVMRALRRDDGSYRQLVRIIQ